MSTKNQPVKRTLKHYDAALAALAASLLISNLAAVKLIAFGPIIADGGAILFPVVYLLGDILTEVYGFKRARRAIWISFAAMLTAVAAFTIVKFLPAAPGWDVQQSYDDILGFFPRIVVASLVVYLFGEFINSYILAKLKVKMKGKKLWFRLISSTFVGQFFDTVIFCLIAFGGVISGNMMVSYIIVGWIFKTLVEVALLPVTYRILNYLKKSEQIDHYDEKTDFTPFSLKA